MILTYAWLDPSATVDENLRHMAEDGAPDLAEAVGAEEKARNSGSFVELLEALRYHASVLGYATLAIDAEEEAAGAGTFLVVAREG